MVLCTPKSPSLYTLSPLLVAQLCLTLCDPLVCPWNSLGKNTGMDCHSCLQGIFPTQGLNPGLLHWQGDSLQSKLPGKPTFYLWSAFPKHVNGWINVSSTSSHKCSTGTLDSTLTKPSSSLPWDSLFCPSPMKLSVHVLVSGFSSIRQSRSSAQLFQDFMINFDNGEIASVFNRQIFLLGEWLLQGGIESLTTCWICFFYFHLCFSLLLFTKRMLSVHNCLPWGNLPLCLNVKPKCLC